MKKGTPLLLVAVLAVMATGVFLFVGGKPLRIHAGEELVRHNISLNRANRRNLRGIKTDEEYVFYFDLVGETELGNPYTSVDKGCYVTCYDANLADFSSTQYICRVESQEGYDYKCSLALTLDARSDVTIKVGMTETTEHVPSIIANVEYNDDGVLIGEPLLMNYDVGYGQNVFFLQGDVHSITLHSVFVSYSCSY